MAEHDAALEAAVEAWCDAELAADDDYARGTIVGEWHLTVSRQGFDENGEPISQTFTTHRGNVTRLLGLLREATMRAEHYLRSHFA